MANGDLSGFDVRPNDRKRQKIDSPTLIGMREWIENHHEVAEVPYSSKEKAMISARDHHRKS